VNDECVQQAKNHSLPDNERSRKLEVLDESSAMALYPGSTRGSEILDFQRVALSQAERAAS
jgi:hypothetical protein